MNGVCCTTVFSSSSHLVDVEEKYKQRDERAPSVPFFRRGSRRGRRPRLTRAVVALVTAAILILFCLLSVLSLIALDGYFTNYYSPCEAVETASPRRSCAREDEASRVLTHVLKTVHTRALAAQFALWCGEVPPSSLTTVASHTARSAQKRQLPQSLPRARKSAVGCSRGERALISFGWFGVAMWCREQRIPLLCDVRMASALSVDGSVTTVDGAAIGAPHAVEAVEEEEEIEDGFYSVEVGSAAAQHACALRDPLQRAFFPRHAVEWVSTTSWRGATREDVLHKGADEADERTVLRLSNQNTNDQPDSSSGSASIVRVATTDRRSAHFSYLCGSGFYANTTASTATSEVNASSREKHRRDAEHKGCSVFCVNPLLVRKGAAVALVVDETDLNHEDDDDDDAEGWRSYDVNLADIDDGLVYDWVIDGEENEHSVSARSIDGADQSAGRRGTQRKEGDDAEKAATVFAREARRNRRHARVYRALQRKDLFECELLDPPASSPATAAHSRSCASAADGKGVNHCDDRDDDDDSTAAAVAAAEREWLLSADVWLSHFGEGLPFLWADVVEEKNREAQHTKNASTPAISATSDSAVSVEAVVDATCTVARRRILPPVTAWMYGESRYSFADYALRPAFLAQFDALLTPFQDPFSDATTHSDTMDQREGRNRVQALEHLTAADEMDRKQRDDSSGDALASHRQSNDTTSASALSHNSGSRQRQPPRHAVTQRRRQTRVQSHSVPSFVSPTTTTSVWTAGHLYQAQFELILWLNKAKRAMQLTSPSQALPPLRGRLGSLLGALSSAPAWHVLPFPSHSSPLVFFGEQSPRAIAAHWQPPNAVQWSRRTPAIAVFISKCWHGRLRWLDAISAHYPVHNYGRCRTKHVPRFEIPEACRRTSSSEPTATPMNSVGSAISLRDVEQRCVLQRYRYALPFENTVEDDYVTEKVYNALLSGAVALYIGAPNIAMYVPHAVPLAEREVRERESADVPSPPRVSVSVPHTRLHPARHDGPSAVVIDLVKEFGLLDAAAWEAEKHRIRTLLAMEESQTVKAVGAVSQGAVERLNSAYAPSSLRKERARAGHSTQADESDRTAHTRTVSAPVCAQCTRLGSVRSGYLSFFLDGSTDDESHRFERRRPQSAGGASQSEAVREGRSTVGAASHSMSLLSRFFHFMLPSFVSVRLISDDSHVASMGQRVHASPRRPLPQKQQQQQQVLSSVAALRRVADKPIHMWALPLSHNGFINASSPFAHTQKDRRASTLQISGAYRKTEESESTVKEEAVKEAVMATATKAHGVHASVVIREDRTEGMQSRVRHRMRNRGSNDDDDNDNYVTSRGNRSPTRSATPQGEGDADVPSGTLFARPSRAQPLEQQLKQKQKEGEEETEERLSPHGNDGFAALAAYLRELDAHPATVEARYLSWWSALHAEEWGHNFVDTLFRPHPLCDVCARALMLKKKKQEKD